MEVSRLIHGDFEGALNGELALEMRGQLARNIRLVMIIEQHRPGCTQMALLICRWQPAQRVPPRRRD